MASHQPGPASGPRKLRTLDWDVEKISWWTLFAVLTGLGVAGGRWRLLLVTLLLWSFYELCVVRTRCRVRSHQGQAACPIVVRGRIFAHDRVHQGIKNDALWRLAYLSNPYRPRVGDARKTGEVLAAAVTRWRFDRKKDRVLIYLAVAGTVVSLMGMLWGLFA